LVKTQYKRSFSYLHELPALLHISVEEQVKAVPFEIVSCFALIRASKTGQQKKSIGLYPTPVGREPHAGQEKSPRQSGEILCSSRLTVISNE